jgi:hypothetical protein
MWNKLIVLTGVIVVLAFIISVSRDNQMVPSLNKGPQPRRQAMNVVMYERNRQNNKTMEVSAREVDETGDQDVRLKDFVLTRPGGLKMSGVDAFYDRTKSILEVKGPVTIETQNGSRARLNNLTWDRVKDFAHTDNPIIIEGESGVITADRAEFSDQFTTIACIGRVHAKVMQNILNL